MYLRVCSLVGRVGRLGSFGLLGWVLLRWIIVVVVIHPSIHPSINSSIFALAQPHTHPIPNLIQSNPYPTPKIQALLAGRFLSGLGVGGLSMAATLYQSETAPSQVRLPCNTRL